jgi:hypothetical protein
VLPPGPPGSRRYIRTSVCRHGSRCIAPTFYALFAQHTSLEELLKAAAIELDELKGARFGSVGQVVEKEAGRHISESRS